MAEVFLSRAPGGKVMLAAIGDDVWDVLTAVQSLSGQVLAADLEALGAIAAKASAEAGDAGRKPAQASRKVKALPAPQVAFTMRAFEIPERMMKPWVEMCPFVDVGSEIKKAHAWVVSGWPRTRKGSWGRFLYNWLSRAQKDAEDERAMGEDLRTSAASLESSNRDYARRVHGI